MNTENIIVTRIDDWSRTLRQRNEVLTDKALKSERLDTSFILSNAACEIERLERLVIQYEGMIEHNSAAADSKRTNEK